MPPLKALPDQEEYKTEHGEFEGRPIEDIRLIVQRTGSGLDKTMKIKPVWLEIGDMTGVLILAETAKVRYEKHHYDDGEVDHNGVDRVQIIDAEGAILLPENSKELAGVRKVIAEVAKREKARKDARRGQMTMEVDPAEEEPPSE